VKAATGGLFVVLFALIGEAVRPKWFAGLFAAAPSIALAGLIITVVDKGVGAASASLLGMTFGAAGLVTFALVARPLLDRFRAVAASAIALMAWSVVAVGGYLGVFH